MNACMYLRCNPDRIQQSNQSKLNLKANRTPYQREIWEKYINACMYLRCSPDRIQQSNQSKLNLKANITPISQTVVRSDILTFPSLHSGGGTQKTPFVLVTYVTKNDCSCRGDLEFSGAIISVSYRAGQEEFYTVSYEKSALFTSEKLLRHMGLCGAKG